MIDKKLLTVCLKYLLAFNHSFLTDSIKLLFLYTFDWDNENNLLHAGLLPVSYESYFRTDLKNICFLYTFSWNKGDRRHLPVSKILFSNPYYNSNFYTDSKNIWFVFTVIFILELWRYFRFIDGHYRLIYFKIKYYLTF